MKGPLTTALLLCGLAVVRAPLAFGQWDYGQSVIDNMVDSRLDRRRTEARMKARQKGRRATTKKRAATRKGATARKTAASAAKPVAPALPRYGIEVRRDSYQDFHLDDINGFKVNFTFVSTATGKTIAKSGVCKLYDQGDPIEGIPAGTYTVRAEVIYGGRKYPAHLGSREGAVENRKGGDFAPTLKIQLKPIIDGGGSRVMGITPKKIYVRVISDRVSAYSKRQRMNSPLWRF